MRCILVSLCIAIFCEVSSANNTILFYHGWYKSKKDVKTKTNLAKVESINPKTVSDTRYLKIGAIIPWLVNGSVTNLVNLEELSLASCGIREIRPGAFQNLPKLSRINLKENGVEHIKEGVFNRMNITVLFLNKNEIKTIAGGAFNNMPRLTKIKLNMNKISKWDSEWFKNSPALVHVSFRRNQIKELPENAFKHLAKFHKHAKAITPDVKIYLSKNHVASMHPKAFDGLNRLGQIWLDRNKLTVLDSSLFSNLHHIQVVVLAKNNLTEVPKDLFKNVKGMKILDITANHRLRCIPFEVVSVVNHTQALNNRNLDCECVRKLQGKIRGLGHEIESECDEEGDK